MKNLIERDKKKRILIKKYEKKRQAYKSIINNYKVLADVRWNASIQLSELPKNSSPVKSNNRCIITGRGKSVGRSFKISRLVFRELGRYGKISGLKKSSW